MNIQSNPPTDVFCETYHAWPLGSDEHWETVFSVSETAFKKQLPSLWTPLTSREERRHAFNDNIGRCLNCHSTAHSMRHCDMQFTNASGILNPELGLLNDNDETFQLWLDRMRCHRSSRHSGTNTKKNNNRNNNDRRSNGNNSARSPYNQHQHGDRQQHQNQGQKHGSNAISVYQPNLGTPSPSVNPVTNTTNTGSRYMSLPSSNPNPNARSPGHFNRG